MEEPVKHIIRNLGVRDLGMLTPEQLQLVQCGLWRAYGTQECFGLFTFKNDMNVWLGHMYCRPAWRGKIAVEIFKLACRKMFEDIGCLRILGLTPPDRRDALVAARSIGFKRIGEAGGYVFSLLEKGDLKWE